MQATIERMIFWDPFFLLVWLFFSVRTAFFAYRQLNRMARRIPRASAWAWSLDAFFLLLARKVNYVLHMEVRDILFLEIW